MSDVRKRRQNQACEQCKKSKKACDGYILNLGLSASPATNASVDTSNNRKGILQCSYCVRTKKQCTLNPQWGRREGRGEAESEKASPPLDSVDWTQSKRPKTTSEFDVGLDWDSNAPSTTSNIGPATTGSDEIFPWLKSPPSSTHPISWGSLAPSLASPSTSTTAIPAINIPATNIPAMEATGLLETVLVGNIHGTLQDSTIDENFALLPRGLADPAFDPIAYNFSQSASTTHSESFPWDFDLSAGFQDTANLAALPDLEADDDKELSHRDRKASRSSDSIWQTKSDLSSSLAGHELALMTNSNNYLIKDNLLRIYHDVLENNLACWLAEPTCPYKTPRLRRLSMEYSIPSPDSIGSSEHQIDLSVRHEWGIDWTNRMYRRVTKLDRVAQSVQLINLTRSQNRAASRALELVIMAFATQWAQGTRRRQRFPSRRSPVSGPSDPRLDSFGEEMEEQFEQNLQQAIWEQARSALQEVADVESYRVVYAELIFGLTQRPWLECDTPPPSPSPHQSRKVKTSVIPRALEILSQEGPPVFMERGAKKMHALKFRFDAREAGLFKCLKKRSAHSNTEPVVTAEDRNTVGLLYWLAVMFDTVSSSMNERPVAFADEDCQHDSAKEQQQAKTKTEPRSTSPARPEKHRWDLDLFAQDNSRNPTVPRWPCDYHQATQAIAKSAPVKVLLYRYVSYLQNAIRKRESAATIEGIVSDVTLVWHYWETTHGAFFRDLTRNYDTVPSRVRSWYVCIAIPWHLGALLIADLLDFVDEQGLGLESAKRERVKSRIAARIRKDTCVELSNLARVTAPHDDLPGVMPVEHLPGFHFAVNEGPLLTEPWSIILIRAFTHASLYHLGVVEEVDEGARDDCIDVDVEESLGRAEDCVKALWFLGRKSQMARDITEVLIPVLEGLQRDDVWT